MPPSETVRRVAPLMTRVGVTRVAEVTHLDRNGVPNFVAARPREPGEGISYYNGKGASRSQARAGAMMEAIERFSGERCDLPVVVGSYEQVRRRGFAVDPSELIVPRARPVDAGTELEWVLGHDLLASRPTYVPLNAVVCPYEPSHAEAPFYSTTNGLASGNTPAEALRQALCEVNERDAMALHQAATRLRRGVADLMARVGLASGGPAAAAEAAYPRIGPEGLPPRAVRIHRRLAGSGLLVYLRDLTSDTGIAVVECVLSERLGPGRHSAHCGYGSHPDARVAVVRALTEAAQSRVGFIQGGREDLPGLSDREPIADPEASFGAGPSRPFAEVATAEHPSALEDVRWILDRFRLAGFPQVVAVDLTRPELGVPAARVVVPRAEAWAIFRIHLPSAPIGPRALARLH